MKPVHLATFAAAAIAAVFLFAGAHSAQAQRPARQAFEYSVDEIPPAFDREERVNRRGAQGWELVALSGNIFVFKRPR